jgi:hypothetical protein
MLMSFACKDEVFARMERAWDSASLEEGAFPFTESPDSLKTDAETNQE